MGGRDFSLCHAVLRDYVIHIFNAYMERNVRYVMHHLPLPSGWYRETVYLLYGLHHSYEVL